VGLDLGVVGHLSRPRSSRIRPANQLDTSRNDGNLREANSQLSGKIRASRQVARVGPGPLSRWRHAFEPRWDYDRKATKSGKPSPVAPAPPALLVRGHSTAPRSPSNSVTETWPSCSRTPTERATRVSSGIRAGGEVGLLASARDSAALGCVVWLRCSQRPGTDDRPSESPHRYRPPMLIPGSLRPPPVSFDLRG